MTESKENYIFMFIQLLGTREYNDVVLGLLPHTMSNFEVTMVPKYIEYHTNSFLMTKIVINNT